MTRPVGFSDWPFFLSLVAGSGNAFSRHGSLRCALLPRKTYTLPAWPTRHDVPLSCPEYRRTRRGAGVLVRAS